VRGPMASSAEWTQVVWLGVGWIAVEMVNLKDAHGCTLKFESPVLVRPQTLLATLRTTPVYAFASSFRDNAQVWRVRRAWLPVRVHRFAPISTGEKMSDKRGGRPPPGGG
jgi:hypothetical protein